MGYTFPGRLDKLMDVKHQHPGDAGTYLAPMVAEFQAPK